MQSPQQLTEIERRRMILMRRAGTLMDQFGWPFERAYRVAVMWLQQEMTQKKIKRVPTDSQKEYTLADKKRLLDPPHERLAARLAAEGMMHSERAHRLAAQTARDTEARNKKD